MPDANAAPFNNGQTNMSTTEDAMLTNHEPGLVLVMTSGKGGVGKTTSSASIGIALAQQGKRVIIIDFDIGLRNLDLVMDTERRVVYDIIHVIRGKASVHQAIIEDRHVPGLAMIAASQTEGKEALTAEGVRRVIAELRKTYDWIICDSPAGIDKANTLTMAHADVAIVVINLDRSSVRDADRVIGLLDEAESRRGRPISKHLLVTKYQAELADNKTLLSLDEVQEMLCLPVIGIVPTDSSVIKASNTGRPVTLEERGTAREAYRETAGRLLGEDTPVTLPTYKRKSLLQRIFSRS